eukprot:COSAG06_NODE_32181_length_510_cov_0.618005_1_plen_28_part_10
MRAAASGLAGGKSLGEGLAARRGWKEAS